MTSLPIICRHWWKIAWPVQEWRQISTSSPPLVVGFLDRHINLHYPKINIYANFVCITFKIRYKYSKFHQKFNVINTYSVYSKWKTGYMIFSEITIDSLIELLILELKLALCGFSLKILKWYLIRAIFNIKTSKPHRW